MKNMFWFYLLCLIIVLAIFSERIYDFFNDKQTHGDFLLEELDESKQEEGT